MIDETTPPPDDSSLPDDVSDGEASPAVPADDTPAAAPESAAPVDSADEADDDAEAIVEDADEAPIEDDEADDDEYYDEADEDEEYDDYGDEDEPLAADDSAPTVDWAAMAAAGAATGVSDVPDLTLSGANAMDVDIDAALAAVDTLGAVVAAEQQRKRDEADRREAQRRADEEYRKWAESYVFRRPGMIRVQGGRIVTILPAVALMAVGSVLTLATTSGQTLSWQTLIAAAAAGLSVSLLSYWMASGRWARGALFSALMVAILGGWIFAASLPDIRIANTLPFAAIGAAFALTGLLGRPRSTVWVVAGVGIAVGAFILPMLSQLVIINAAPFVLAAAAVLALLPLIFRTGRR